MSKWKCYGRITSSKYLGEVEADTEDEALEKAIGLDTAFISLCHQCSREMDDPEVTEVNVERKP